MRALFQRQVWLGKGKVEPKRRPNIAHPLIFPVKKPVTHQTATAKIEKRMIDGAGPMLM